MHTNSWLAFRYHAASHVPNGRVLEVGADGRPSTYQREVPTFQGEWLHADLATEDGKWNTTHMPTADVLMPTEYEVPVPPGSFDAVISGNVLEHVRKPWRWISAMAECLRTGGVLITVAPVSWVYHEAPVDCFRYYPEGMNSLLEEAGLQRVVSWWGSYEPAGRRHYPGISPFSVPQLFPGHNRLKRALGWPMPRAYDMVSVAKKVR